MKFNEPMQLNCIAIDDEPLALRLLCEYIDKTPQLKLLQTFDDAVEANYFLQKNTVQLLFTDINMPDMNGIDIVRNLSYRPMVIFATAHKQFAYEGFELDAVDYLLKPFEFSRFEKAVKKAVEFYQHGLNTGNGIPQSIFVRSEYKLIQITLSEIDYVEGLEDYVKIHIAKQKPVLTLQTLKAMQEKLRKDFVRVHRSYILPLSKIRAIRNKKVILSSGIELPVGDSYYEELMQRMKS